MAIKVEKEKARGHQIPKAKEKGKAKTKASQSKKTANPRGDPGMQRRLQRAQASQKTRAAKVVANPLLRAAHGSSQIPRVVGAGAEAEDVAVVVNRTCSGRRLNQCSSGRQIL